MSRGIEEALDNCLDRIEADGFSVDEALISYPQYREELEPLLRMAVELRSLPRVVAPERLRTSGRPVFQARPSSAPEDIRSRLSGWRPVWPAFGWSPAVARLAAAFAATFLVLGGTVVASAGSLPEEPLYPVKLAVEEVQLALTPDSHGRAELHLQFASRRLGEVEEAARRGNPQAVETALALYQERLEDAGLSPQVDSESEAGVDEQAARASLEQLKGVLTKLEGESEVQSGGDEPSSGHQENSRAVEAIGRVIAAFEQDVPPGSLVEPGSKNTGSSKSRGKGDPTSTAESPGKSGVHPSSSAGPRKEDADLDSKGQEKQANPGQAKAQGQQEPATPEVPKGQDDRESKPPKATETAPPTQETGPPAGQDNQDGSRGGQSSRGNRSR